MGIWNSSGKVTERALSYVCALCVHLHAYGWACRCVHKCTLATLTAALALRNLLFHQPRKSWASRLLSHSF